MKYDLWRTDVDNGTKISGCGYTETVFYLLKYKLFMQIKAAARVNWIAGFPAVFIQGPVIETYTRIYKNMHCGRHEGKASGGGGPATQGGGGGGETGRTSRTGGHTTINNK